ncbi:hypothetical protein [Endozoicomonas sp. ALB032]|uniref:hypothetical protein n=1 Tax=Endozoicomonas sp. ALB032 TaxID=3403082 RepID=UPI003BB62253
MKKSFNLFPLLLCLLYSMAKAASLPAKNDFDFLKHFNGTALVENGLELKQSITGISLSTLLNLGIWWGVCKTAQIVSGPSGKYDLAALDTEELEKLKTDFCLQLAPVVTTAEVALAGHVSPWPLEQRWWKPQYFAGAGVTAYASMTKARELVPFAVLTYLASEAASRTGASAVSVLILRKMSVRNITAERYAAGEYAVLSLINGVMAGYAVCEAMIHKGFSPKTALLASLVSIGIVVISEFVMNVDGLAKAAAEAETRAAAETRAEAEKRVAAETRSTALAVLGAIAVAELGVLAVAEPLVVGAATGALSGTLAGAVVGAVVGVGAGAGIGAGVGASALGGVGTLLMFGSSKITSNNPFIIAGVTLVPALTFAVINSLSNYAVYGYPLEQGLTETDRNLWKKFYAPLDYLSTLFN